MDLFELFILNCRVLVVHLYHRPMFSHVWRKLSWNWKKKNVQKSPTQVLSLCIRIYVRLWALFYHFRTGNAIPVAPWQRVINAEPTNRPRQSSWTHATCHFLFEEIAVLFHYRKWNHEKIVPFILFFSINVGAVVNYGRTTFWHEQMNDRPFCVTKLILYPLIQSESCQKSANRQKMVLKPKVWLHFQCFF